MPYVDTQSIWSVSNRQRRACAQDRKTHVLWSSPQKHVAREKHFKAFLLCLSLPTLREMIRIADVGVMCAVETLSIARVSRQAGLFSVDGLGMYLEEVGSQHIAFALSVIFPYSLQLNDGIIHQ